jgi:hypothetical protein
LHKHYNSVWVFEKRREKMKNKNPAEKALADEIHPSSIMEVWAQEMDRPSPRLREDLSILLREWEDLD